MIPRQMMKPKSTMNHNTRNVLSKDIAENYTLVKQAAVTETVKNLIALMACSLHMEYGFGTDRINRVVDRTRSQLEAVMSDVLSMEEAIQWCEDNKINYK